MAFLRRVKTTIHASKGSASTTPSSTHSGSNQDSLLSAQFQGGSQLFDRNTEVESSSRDRSAKQHQKAHHPFSNFRRRLARKASTFSLRGTTRQEALQEAQQPKAQSSKPLNGLSRQRGASSVDSKPNHSPNHEQQCGWPSTKLATLQQDLKSGLGTPVAVGTQETNRLDRPERFPIFLPASSILPKAFPDSLVKAIRAKQNHRAQEGFLHRSQSHDHTFVKMASENAAPPVPYARLQEITVSACEKALSSVTSYSHAATEGWNTTIINTILGTLVLETTPPATTGSTPQPAFKYVVNSTIIQHAPTSSSGSSDPAVTGRRGMHAASGAFWNNEKDGMWSYKYSAAEKKGLDVVVGVTWIWAG